MCMCMATVRDNYGMLIDVHWRGFQTYSAHDVGRDGAELVGAQPACACCAET